MISAPGCLVYGHGVTESPLSRAPFPCQDVLFVGNADTSPNPFLSSTSNPTTQFFLEILHWLTSSHYTWLCTGLLLVNLHATLYRIHRLLVTR